MGLRALALAACLWIACCAREPEALTTFGPDVDAIASAEHQLNELTAARDVEAVMTLYHADALMIGPNGQRLAPGDIRRYYQAMADDPSGRLEIGRASTIEVAAEGLAYSTGGYTEIHADGDAGQVRVTSGQTLRIWKRENNGWRIAIETRTPSQVRIN